ncbi:MAG TPA: hypothetical protein VK875_07785 [Euzebyales bacterium]|nr:hypothetical protein [Euzebyales bacterium]
MDLGRPVARHIIRRPHEAIDLDTEATLDEHAGEEQELSSESTEH